jgi:hypothetical protein
VKTVLTLFHGTHIDRVRDNLIVAVGAESHCVSNLLRDQITVSVGDVYGPMRALSQDIFAGMDCEIPHSSSCLVLSSYWRKAILAQSPTIVPTQPLFNTSKVTLLKPASADVRPHSYPCRIDGFRL